MSKIETKKRIKSFLNFIDNQINSAVEELDRLADGHRVHLQKLVYTNLVDRFDTLVDDLIKINSRNEMVLEKALKPLQQPITEADLIRYLMDATDLSGVFDLKIEEGLRNTILRERHSKKLQFLLSALKPDEHLKKPRVKRATGEISDFEKIYDKSVPHSIPGYADYLYSRRNSLVHGAGESKFLKRDKEQINKLFEVKVTTSFRITYNAVPVAVRFYSDLAEMIMK